MTPDQGKELAAMLEAAELWLLMIVRRAAGYDDAESQRLARDHLIDTIDDLASAMELDEDHGGLGRGGER